MDYYSLRPRQSPSPRKGISPLYNSTSPRYRTTTSTWTTIPYHTTPHHLQNGLFNEQIQLTSNYINFKFSYYCWPTKLPDWPKAVHQTLTPYTFYNPLWPYLTLPYLTCSSVARMKFTPTPKLSARVYPKAFELIIHIIIPDCRTSPPYLRHPI